MSTTPFQWTEPESQVKPGGAKDSAAAAVRGGSSVAAPTLIRMGTGIGSGLLQNIPLAGNVLGGALSGGGEVVAQMLENQSTDLSKINKKRVALETALGAVPAGWLIKEGNALKSAALAGTAAATGVVGRKLTADNPEDRKIHPASDLFNIALGAGVGGAMGHFANPKEVRVPDNWEVEPTAVPGGRTLGTKPNAPSEAVTAVSPIPKGPPTPPAVPPPAPANPEGPVPIAGQPPAPYRSAAKAAVKADTSAVEKGWQQEARNMNSRDKYLAGVAKETDKESLQVEAQRNKDWAQEAKNLNAKDEYLQAQRNATAVQKRLDALEAAGAKPQTVVTKTSKMEAPDSTVTATTVIKAGKKTKGTGPKAAPGPVAPKPGVFQIIQKNGKVVEATDADTAEALANAAGKGTVVVPPPEAAPVVPAAVPAEATPAVPVAEAAAPIPTATPKPKKGLKIAGKKAKLTGTPSEVVAQLDKPTVPPEAPPVAAAAVPTPKPPSGPAAAAVEPPAAPTAGLKVSAPLAMKVAQVLGDTPAGSAIARFFPNKAAALKAGAYAEELPGEAIGPLGQLIGKAEASKALGKAEGNPNLSEAGGKLWQLVSQIGKEQNLPQMPRGASAKPSFKLAKTPSGEKFVPPSDAPVIDLTQPKAPAAPAQVAAPAGPPPQGSQMAAPRKPISVIEPGIAPEPPAFPPIETGRPLPAALKIRIKTAQDQMQALQNAGKGTGAEADKLAADIEGLQRESFAAQYPEWAAEAAKAEQAPDVAGPTAKPKRVRKPKGGSEAGFVTPEMLIKGLPTAIGAAAGAGMDQDNRLRGAVLGGAAGYGVGHGLSSLGSGGKPLVEWDPSQPGNSIARMLASYQRFNYLTDPLGLAINAGAAPFGAGLTGSVERALVGKFEGNPDKTAQGLNSIRELLRSYVGKDAPTYLSDAYRNAKGLIGRAEEGDANRLHTAEPSKFSDVMAMPGRAMTTGDVMSREALVRGGTPDEIARGITVTSNPRYKGVGEPIVNFTKSSPVSQLLLPFSRTAANILEGSLERTPIVGFMLNKTNDPTVKATMAEMLTRQGLGGGVWYASYELGKHAPPEASKDYKFGTLISNMAGQYGLIASAGFAAGQAEQLGTSSGSAGDKLGESAKQMLFGYPLPSTRTATDLAGVAKNWLNGEPAHPDATEWSRRNLPYAAVPGFVPVLEDAIQKPPQALKAFAWQQ